VIAALAALVVVGCTSPTSDKKADTGGGAGAPDNSPTIGITNDTVRISLVVADLSLLTQQHLAPDLGDAVKAARAVVDEINATGGVVGGRKLVLSAHKIGNAPIATAATLQRACVQATEEDKPLAVLVAAAVPVNVVECAAVSHDQLAITMDSWQKKVYDDARGRIFSVASQLSVSIERSYAFLATLLAQEHALDGKTVGILNQDQPSDRIAAGSAMKQALSAAGIKVAAEATVPYPEGSQTCTQTDVGVQKMKQAKVNFVFLLAQNLCSAAIVQAAAKAGFTPQWATTGNNVTDTVAQFFAPAKNNYDGAWGLGGALPEPSKAADDCNAIVARRAGLRYTRGSDAYGFAAVTCLQVQTLADALKAAKEPLTQAAVVRDLEALTSVPMNVGPAGSLSPTKHDAGDYVYLEKYHAADGKFVPVDHTPRRIP
jgi:ABC-type branched-subunit amino acid transport system substrate-binding protein